jgi:hypothetical protein
VLDRLRVRDAADELLPDHVIQRFERRYGLTAPAP